MNRRELIAVLGASAALCSVPFAQARDRKRVVGLLWHGAADDPDFKRRFGALAQGLAGLGWIDGQNMTFAVKHAVGDSEQFPAMAADLVHMNVDVIVTSSVGLASLARQATRTIPIVVSIGGDLEGSGLIENLRRPGGNVTGIQTLAPDLMSKRVDLLKRLIPTLTRLGAIVPITSDGMVTPRFLEQITEAARAMKIEVLPVEVGTPQEVAPAIAALAQQAQAALLITTPFAAANAKLILDAAAQSRLPIMYDFPAFTFGGGLLSYGPNHLELIRQSAGIVAKLLNGADPAELPVQQPTKFELAINLKAAKELGLDVPPTLIALADEVVE